jgi:MoaA/NifB/PqqE/SkfB family radical SAM enzyme
MNSVKNLELIKMYFLNISSGFKGIFCDLPFDQLCIDAFGNVLPCYKANKFFTESLGNLLSKKPEDVWNSETYVKSRKLSSRCMKRCMLGDGYVSNDGIFSNAKRFYMGFRKNIGS